jgi:hypothetical protein
MFERCSKDGGRVSVVACRKCAERSECSVCRGCRVQGAGRRAQGAGRRAQGAGCHRGSDAQRLTVVEVVRANGCLHLGCELVARVPCPVGGRARLLDGPVELVRVETAAVQEVGDGGLARVPAERADALRGAGAAVANRRPLQVRHIAAVHDVPHQHGDIDPRVGFARDEKIVLLELGEGVEKGPDHVVVVQSGRRVVRGAVAGGVAQAAVAVAEADPGRVLEVQHTGELRPRCRVVVQLGDRSGVLRHGVAVEH